MKDSLRSHFMNAKPVLCEGTHRNWNRTFLLTWLFVFLQFFAFAQSKISGTVKDSKGNAVPAVTVREKSGSASAITDDDGNFSISVSKADASLIFSSAGFSTTEIQIQGRSTFDIVIDENSSKLNEVVVVGYGSQSRQKLTTSVAKLDSKALENLSYPNVSAALQGGLTGVRVQTTSGEPGAASRIIVRGGTSINNPNGAAPLYIIDGVIRDAGLTDLNSDDIESLQVLKDAASTAIYGSRGSNGVVIVTTKSGKAGKTAMSFSYAGTFSKPGNTVDYISGRDYIQYNRLGIQAALIKNPALAARFTQANASGTGNDLTKSSAYTTMFLIPANEFKLQQGWESMPDPLDPTKTIIFKDTKYRDLIYQNGLTHDYNLSASGGTGKATFNTGLGYLTSEGTVVSTEYKRLSFNFNGTLQLTDNFQLYSRLLYTNRSNRAVANYSNLFYRSASLPGTSKYQFEDSTMAPGQNSSIGNPDYYFKGPYSLRGKNTAENTIMTVGSRWEVIKGLSFEPSVSLLRANTDFYSFQPAALLNGVGAIVNTRNTTANYSKTTQYQADAFLTYLRTFGDGHHFQAKAGYSHYSRNIQTQTGTGQGAATDNITTLNASAIPVTVGGTISDLRISGLVARVDYDFQEKYLLTLNYRYDGSSNLGTTNQFGAFPGVSVGWNLDKEKFWGSIFPNQLLTFKVRGSWGVNGNISGLGDFQALGNYAVNTQYGTNAAVVQSVLPNPDLKWEKSRTLDLGFDAGLFDRRISIIFDRFRRVTDDLLTTVRLPISSGYATVFTNLGSLENNGYELELNFNILSPKSPLQWNFSVNGSYVESKILRLPPNGIDKNRIGGVNVYDPLTKSYQWMGGLQEGGRVGDMYAHQLTGVFATDQEAAAGPVDQSVATANKTKFAGDAKWLDVDGNNIIDSRDQVYVGNPYPKWTGGLSNNVSYKNLSFFVRMDYTLGATIYNYPAIFADGQLQGDALPTQKYIDAMWKKPGDVTNTPRYVWQNQFGNIRPNDTYYEKGDFLCLREVTLAYNLSGDWMRKLKLSGFRINFSGSNLHYFTKYSGQVPDDGGQDNGHFPIPVNLTLGARITF